MTFRYVFIFSRKNNYNGGFETSGYQIKSVKKALARQENKWIRKQNLLLAESAFHKYIY